MSNTGKIEFIKLVETLCGNEIESSPLAAQFWNELKTSVDKPLSEKSMAVLTWMQDNKEKYNNVFTSAVVGAGLGITGRSVSGTMPSLISKGYITKLGGSPVAYSLT